MRTVKVLRSLWRCGKEDLDRDGWSLRAFKAFKMRDWRVNVVDSVGKGMGRSRVAITCLGGGRRR